MKSMMLLRHAEALPATAAVADLDRVLSNLGKRQARAQGKWLRARVWTPQAVLCSAAARARQTAEALCAAAGWTTAMIVREELYNASADTMLAVLRAQAREVDRLLLVAHAPGVGELASSLTTRESDLALACEPATLIEVCADINDWSTLARRCGTLHLVLPA